MPVSTHVADPEPARADIDVLSGATVLEFGTPWCGYCVAAQPLISTALNNQPSVRHIKVEDGSGRPLGRSFKVKLWPTLIFIVDGREITRVVRPADIESLQQALAAIRQN